MLFLICNVGSTSLKYKLFDMPSEKLLVESKIERVGSIGQSIFQYINYNNGQQLDEKDINVPGYSEGINLFLKYLQDDKFGAIATLDELSAVGFKTVHAGECSGVQELTDDVIKAMEKYVTAVPLHNTYYIQAIKKFKEVLPGKTMVGVFETAFHRTIPLEARVYGVPYEWYDKYKIQRFGFHGASHQYIAKRISSKYACGKDYRLISCHLGGSSSISAVKDGKSVDNSFGFSSQSGLPHGSRTGDLDPFVLVHLMKEEGFTLDEVLQGITKNGGLLGISGVSSDMRDIQIQADLGNKRAELAINVFCYNVKKYIGSYYAILGGLDYLVFTGGIGENSVLVRNKICEGLKHMGIELDYELNQGGGKERGISTKGSAVKIMIVPTNEEIGIADNIYELLNAN